MTDSSGAMKVSDQVRLSVVTETIDSLQSVIKSGDTGVLSNVAAIVTQMKNEKTLFYLVDIAEKSKGDPDMIELPTERDFDTIVKAALMLCALQTRTDPNITSSALRSLEESAVFSQVKGFFTNDYVRKMVDQLINHYATLVKKRIIKQKEAETLIHGAIMNFECSAVDYKLLN
jgi:hypothetical protein